MFEYNKLCEEALLKLVSDNDSKAEEELALRYSRIVRSRVRPYFLIGGDTEDLIQEGMIGLLSAIREYQPDKNVSFKIFAELCIQNRISTAIRNANRKKHDPLNSGISLDDLSEAESISLQRTPEDAILADEFETEFAKACAKNLSIFESKVLNLYLTGLPYKDIANFLNKDVKSVDNAVQRIRRKLTVLFLVR